MSTIPRPSGRTDVGLAAVGALRALCLFALARSRSRSSTSPSTDSRRAWHRTRPTGSSSPAPSSRAEGIPLAVKDLFDTAGLTRPTARRSSPSTCPTETAEAVRLLEAARLRQRRQDEPARVRLRDDLREPALRHRAEPASRRAGSPAARAAARRRRSPPGSPTRRSAPTPAARSGSRPRAAASSASSRPTGSSRCDGCFPLAPSFDHAGPMARDVEGCARDAGGARARVRACGARARRRRGRRRLDRARRPARPRAGRGRRRAVPTHARPVELPLARTVDTCFMREVADVHRELFAEHADSTARTSARRSSAASRVTRRRVRAGSASRRERYREQLAEAAAGVDLVLTPTLALRRAAGAGRRARDPRPADLADAAVQRPRLAGARASVRAAEDGLPASVQLAAPPGRGRPRARRAGARSSGRCPSIERHSNEGLPRRARCRQLLLMACARLTAALVAALAVARARRREPLRRRPRPQELRALHAPRGRARRAHVLAHAVVCLEPRRAARRATTSSSRRARTSRTAASSGRARELQEPGRRGPDLRCPG